MMMMMNALPTTSSAAATALSAPGGAEFKKKKTRTLMPTVRFELKLDKPMSNKFAQFDYNKLMLKTFKLMRKRNRKELKLIKKCIKHNDGSGGEMAESLDKKYQTISKSDLSILDGELRVERERIENLVKNYRTRIALSKEYERKDMLKEEGANDDDDIDDDEDELKEDYSDEYDDEEDDDDDDGGGGGRDEYNFENVAGKSKTTTTSKKKSPATSSIYDLDAKHFKLKDFNYLGQGYDDNDSFIDNTDAYDVRIPSNLAPKHGGFYINKGKIKLEKIETKKKSNNKSSKKTTTASNETESNRNNNDNNNNSENEEEDEDYEESSDFDSDEDGSSSSCESSSDDDDDDDDSDDDSDNSDSDESGSGEEESSENNKNKNNKESTKKTVKIIESDDDENDESSPNKQQIDSKKSKYRRKLIDDNENEKESRRKSNNLKTSSDESNEIILLDSKIRSATSLKQTNSDVSLNNDNCAGSNQIKSNNNNNSINNNNISKKRKKDSDSRSSSPKDFRKIQSSSNDDPLMSNPNPNPVYQQKIVKDNMDNKKIKIDESNLVSTTTNNSNNRHLQSNTINQNKNERTQMKEASIDTKQQTPINGMKFETNNENESSNSLKMLTLDDMPVSLPSDLREQVVALVNEDQQSQKFGPMMHRIYQQCRFINPNDREKIFQIISNKLNIDKKILLTQYNNIIVRAQKNQALKQQQQGNSNTKQNVTNTNNNNTQSQSAINLNKSLSVSSPSAANPTASATFYDLNQDIKDKLIVIEKEFTLVKQRNEQTEKFFETSKALSLINSLEASMKSGNNNNKSYRAVKDLVLEIIGKSSGLSKEVLIKKFNDIKVKTAHNQINNKLKELKVLIDAEMPKCMQRYEAACEEYRKNKTNDHGNATAADDCVGKKKSAPRKRFEWTPKCKELFLSIVNMRFMFYNRAQSNSTQEQEQNNRIEFIKPYLMNSVIKLWPEGWMQMNILLNMIQTKQQQNQINNNIKNNVSPLSTLNNSFNSPFKGNNSSVGNNTPTTTAANMANNFYSNNNNIMSDNQLSKTPQSINNNSKLNSPSIQKSASAVTSLSSMTTMSAPTTPVSSSASAQSRIINVASKSGKQIRLEPLTNSPSTPTSTHFSSPGFIKQPQSQQQQQQPQQQQSKPQTPQQINNFSSNLNNFTSPNKQNVYNTVVNAHKSKFNQQQPQSQSQPTVDQQSLNKNQLIQHNNNKLNLNQIPSSSSSSSYFGQQQQFQQQQQQQSIQNQNMLFDKSASSPSLQRVHLDLNKSVGSSSIGLDFQQPAFIQQHHQQQQQQHHQQKFNN